MYHYHRRDRENLYFPFKTCTTTIAEDPVDVKFRVVTPNIYGHEPLLPSTTRERLLPLRTDPLRNACFEGITPRRPSENDCMCCMRCTLCLHHVCSVSRFHAIDSWDTRYPGAPYHLLHASAHFSFASVSQSSYRDRNVAVAPFPLSLPWHPFSFRHDDKCLISYHVNVFINIA